MHPRNPGIQLDEGELIWSKIPEFSMAFNGYSVVIPYVEHYLNAVMNKTKSDHCHDNPKLAEELSVFIKQETFHSRYHMRFNQRMFDAGYEGLKELIEDVVAELKELRETRSLAFNLAYCTGFESIATFDAKYLWTECDEYFEGAEPTGANLLLWHVAEEFEHRAVCHDAFMQVSGNYFTRIYGLLYAFIHIGGFFMKAEHLILEHHQKDMTEQERKASKKRSKKIFWRQLRYVAPRMLRIFLPWYNPAQVKVPKRVANALSFFDNSGPINNRVGFI
jgi:uncharacterized protein